MDNELDSVKLRVIGWSPITKSATRKKLEENMKNCKTINYETFKELDDDELCVYLFLDDTSNEKPRAYLGRVRFIQREPGTSWRLPYKFYPIKRIDIQDIIYCKCCWEPWKVYVQESELPKNDFE